jgi:proline racemase
LPLEIDGIGRIVTDIAYGGAFYALLPASRIGLRLRESPLSQLVSAAGMITRHIRRVIKIAHPIESDLSFLYGTILTDDEAADSGRATHNICVFGDSQVDRSPTGSGVVARMALDFAKGLLTPGATREFVGPSEQSFHGTLESPEAVAQHAGVRVRVAGCAYYTGRSEFIVEESDPLADGFSIGDMQHH